MSAQDLRFRAFGLCVICALLFPLAAGAGDAKGGFPETLEAPLALDPEIREWVHRLVPGKRSPQRRLQFLLNALLDPSRGLRQVGYRTFTAREAFAEREADCVGFAFLFVGLAREAGVPAFFVLVEDAAEVEKRGRYTVTEQHLAAAYGTGVHLRVYDFEGETAGHQHCLTPISDLSALALYYSNLGTERLVAGDPEATRWLRRSIELDPKLASTWINLGVALRRQGELEAAREAYEQALALDPSPLVYRNLARLLRGQGRVQEAKEFEAWAKRLDATDVSGYLELGRTLLEDGDVEGARAYYRKALDMARQRH